jgi:flagellar FliL protein
VAEDQETREQEPKKKSGKLKWIILVVLLLVLGGGGYFAYTQFLQKPPDQAETGEEGAEEGAAAEEEMAEGESSMVTLPTFLVNLADPLGRRYLKLTVDVEVKNEAAAEELRENEAKVRDAIILLLSSKSYSDLSTLEGKILLKKEIVERLNLLLGSPKVKRVYFTEMVVQ